MKRARLIGAGIAVAALIAAPATWYHGSPWWTLWRMREAAQAGDIRALAAYIDQPTLAAREKARARALWGSALTTPLGDSDNARRFVALAGRKLEEVEREAAAGPTELAGWLAEIPVRWGGLGGYRTKDQDPVVVRHGPGRFDLRDRRHSGENGPVLGFRRHGLGWKLEDVRRGRQ